MEEASEAAGSAPFEPAQGNRGTSTATLNTSGDAPLAPSQPEARKTAKDAAARAGEDKKPKAASFLPDLSEKPAAGTSIDSPLSSPGVPMKENEPLLIAASMPGSSAAASKFAPLEPFWGRPGFETSATVAGEQQLAWQRNLSPAGAGSAQSSPEISVNSAMGAGQKPHAVAAVAADTGGASPSSKANSHGTQDTPTGPTSSQASTPSASALQESKPAAGGIATGSVMPTQDAAANATPSPGHGVGAALAVQNVIHGPATPAFATPGLATPGLATPGLQIDGLTRGASVHPLSGNSNPHAILDGVGPASGSAREAVWQLSPTRVEAGFASAQNSWISVVAQRQQGHLTATLELGSAAEHGGLESILPQLSTHLVERQLPVDQLGVSVRQQFFSGNGAGSGADGGAGDPNQGQQRGHSSPPEREPLPLTEMAAGAAGSPANEGRSRFSVRV